MQMEMLFERSELDALHKPTMLKAVAATLRPKPKKATAIDVVDETLRACLPPDVPPSFVEILSASKAGTGRNETITAKLSMIDGTVATVRLKKWAMGWSHQYMDLPGGTLYWDGGRWVHDSTE
ncbi:MULTISPECIES: hypothetical protein [Agrobacterium]|uniref:hypothetical protein n=1 Tax=Agrobacterium tumefaciens TaxID=358 RepID=UPI00157483AD|nr:hypothetical protein [Agrobacterium tumefaciens]